MSLKSKFRDVCHKNKVLARNYDKLTWYKSRLETVFISDIAYAKKTYRKRCGKTLNLQNPQTFDEKLWYLKLHNRDPLLTICSDKYRVREYVEHCGLGFLLNELYGVYDNARDIEFSKFHEPVFLKCNHTSGDNVIYDPHKPFDQEDFVKRFNFVLKQNSYVKSREWNYKNIKPKIIAEKVLRDKNGKLPLDYKFLCFDGEPKLLFLDIDVCTEDGKHNAINYRNVYDMNFRLLDMTETRDHKDLDTIKKPENFEKMAEYAAILSKPFAQCRIDFYNIDGKIYFGEITFYHGGGCNNIQPREWDLKIGSWIDINNITNEDVL